MKANPIVVWMKLGLPGACAALVQCVGGARDSSHSRPSSSVKEGPGKMQSQAFLVCLSSLPGPSVDIPLDFGGQESIMTLKAMTVW